MEDKVVSFEKGIHREPSLGAVGELSDCVNLYSEGTEMKMMPHVEGVRNIPEGWVCRYVHENGGDYSHLVMVGEKSVESASAEEGASANALETVVADGESADGEASETVAVVGWLPMEYESGETVTEVMVLGSGESVRNITSIGNVLVIGTSEKMYYWLWSEGEYVDYSLDNIENLDIQFTLDGTYVRKGGSSVKIIKLDSSKVSDTEYEVLASGTFSRGMTIQNGNRRYPIEVIGCNIAANSNYRVGWQGDEPLKLNIYVSNNNNYDIVSGVDIPIGQTYHDDGIYPFNFKTGANGYSYIKVTSYEVYGGSKVIEVSKLKEGVSKYVYALDKEEDTYIDILESDIAKYINENATKKNMFMHPFFVRTAIELVDGTMVKPSSPMLMIPNSGVVPYCYLNNDMKGDDGNLVDEKSLSPQFTAICCDLKYTIKNEQALNYIKSRDKLIKGVVIAVSQPVQRYNSGLTYEEKRASFYVNDIAEIDRGVTVGSVVGYKSGKSGEWQLENIDKQNVNTPYFYISLPEHDNIKENVINNNIFRIVKKYKLDELTANTTAKVEMESGTLSSLNGLRMLEDNAISLNTFNAKCLYTYNGRLVLGNYTKTFFDGYSPMCMNGCSERYIDETDSIMRTITKVRCEVTLSINNKEVTVVNDDPTAICKSESRLNWLYYPNENAKNITIYIGYKDTDGVTNMCVARTFELEKHPYLNGAYWFGGLVDGVEHWSVWEEATYPSGTQEIKHLYQNEILSTLLNNPFAIDVNSECAVGMGEIKKLISNTKALSAGQFGQHPVLAFCSDGIWAMAVSSEGGFSAVQPVSRDVVSNAESITQTDSAVAFVTDRGLMMIDGSDVKELCQFMDNRENFDVEGACAQLVDGFEELFVEESDSWLDVLREAKLVYDYQNSLLWVMPQQDVDDEEASRNKWYAVSLKNSEVYGYVCPDVSGRGLNRFYGPVSVVPGYPQSYMQMKNVYRRNNAVASKMVLAKFGYEQGNGKSKGWLVTRAIPFGNAYAMKMLYDMKVEKMFGEGSSAKVAVFVSNDRVHWGRLTSMKGRSYKWYRFAVFCDMSDVDRLTGLICRIDERRTNKLR